MSRASLDAELSALRAVSFRLSSTPTAQLPQQIPAITASLSSCKSIMSTASASASKSSSEATVALHKYRTLLSTLFQDRSVQGRWSAIVLVKSTIEMGGWEALQKSLPWVRGLLGVLTKPDPPSSKKLCIITLTRIFSLTRDYPTLVREITTPSLPTFIQSCLQIVSSRPPQGLLQSILESFGQLLPRHPTVFRSYAKQLQQLLAQIVGATPSSRLGKETYTSAVAQPSAEVTESARQLYVQLSCCAPKGASSEEWSTTIKNLLATSHQVADKVFRAVVEDWHPSHGDGTSAPNGHKIDAEVQELEKDALGLPPWSGIFAGGERIVALLRLLNAFLANSTSNFVHVQLGHVLDLVMRLSATTTPSTTNTVRFNNQISKDERESLWAILPHIHATALETLATMSKRLDKGTVALDSVVLDQVNWIFGSEKSDGNVRAACYLLVAEILARSGSTLPKSSIEPLGGLFRHCCEDLLPIEPAHTETIPTQAQGKANGSTPKQSTMNADAFLKPSSITQNPVGSFPGLRQAAHNLLPIILATIPPQHLSDSNRNRIDRTAILTKHKDAMTASILNPPPNTRSGRPVASIVPLLARAYPFEPEVEAILRPRMPVTRIGKQDDEDDGDVDVEEDPMEEEDEERFVGEELDTLLESANQTEQLPSKPENTTSDLSIRDAPPTASVPGVDRDENIQIIDISRGNATNKRPQIEEELPSSVKRAKTDTDTEISITDAPTIPSTILIEASSHDAVVVPAVAPERNQIQVESLSTNIITPAADDNSDDDDDFGELVLGQDTDDESDS